MKSFPNRLCIPLSCCSCGLLWCLWTSYPVSRKSKSRLSPHYPLRRMKLSSLRELPLKTLLKCPQEIPRMQAEGSAPGCPGMDPIVTALTPRPMGGWLQAVKGRRQICRESVKFLGFHLSQGQSPLGPEGKEAAGLMLVPST